jgi:hypothetical protein
MPTYEHQIRWRLDNPPPCRPARSFLPLLRAAVASNPERLDLLLDLVVALRDDQRWQDSVELLSPLAERGGLTPPLACELARAAIASARPALALSVLDAPTAGAEARRQRVFALYALNRIEPARAAALQSLEDAPGDGAVLDLFATDCLKHGASDALADWCRGQIDRGTGSSKHLAYLSAALAASGRADELAAIHNPERLFSRAELDITQVDNEALAQAILTHPALVASSDDKPTHGRNLRLEGLPAVTHPAIRNLLGVIRQQVDAYLADRRAMPHPLIANRPHTARLRGWALVLSQDGHEETHIHPQGWLSIVYYVRVPQTPSRSADGAAPPPGSLVFGPWPPALADALPEFPTWHAAPKAGTLLMFPSFFGHGTIPTGLDEPRLCVVLDVVACAPSPALPT